MAAPLYIDNGGIATGIGASVDVPFTGTVNENDILIITVGDADNDTFSIPVGWERIAAESTNTNCSYDSFWLRAAGTESGTVTCTSALTAGQLVWGVMTRFSNCVLTGIPYEIMTSDPVVRSTSTSV